MGHVGLTRALNAAWSLEAKKAPEQFLVSGNLASGQTPETCCITLSKDGWPIAGGLRVPII